MGAVNKICSEGGGGVQFPEPVKTKKYGKRQEGRLAKMLRTDINSLIYYGHPNGNLDLYGPLAFGKRSIKV